MELEATALQTESPGQLVIFSERFNFKELRYLDWKFRSFLWVRTHARDNVRSKGRQGNNGLYVYRHIQMSQCIDDDEQTNEWTNERVRGPIRTEVMYWRSCKVHDNEIIAPTTFVGLLKSVNAENELHAASWHSSNTSSWRGTRDIVRRRLSYFQGCRHSSVDSSAPSILRHGFEFQAHHLFFYQ